MTIELAWRLPRVLILLTAMKFRSCFLTDAKGSDLTTEAPRSSCKFERRIRISAYEGGRALLAGLLLPSFCRGLMAQSDSNYRLAADDLLTRVFQEPELDAVIRVAGDGTAISLWWVDSMVYIIGDATELLRQRYMGLPRQSADHPDGSNVCTQGLHDLGTGYEAGSYAIEGNRPSAFLTRSEWLVATPIGNPGKVTVKRRVGGQKRLSALMLKRWQGRVPTQHFKSSQGRHHCGGIHFLIMPENPSDQQLPPPSSLGERIRSGSGHWLLLPSLKALSLAFPHDRHFSVATP